MNTIKAHKIWNFDIGSLIREEDLNGRHYIVVPMTMILEGVHTGSQGPVYYSLDELAKTPKMWNMKPVVIEHPFRGDTATDLEVYKKQAVGMIMNCHFIDGKLKAEAWIDQELAQEKCPELLEHITHKLPMEISTGLFSELVMDEGVWKGEPYKGRIINIRADHLAILPHKQGACSLSDGAGLLINQKQTSNDTLNIITTIINAQEYPAGSIVIADEDKPTDDKDDNNADIRGTTQTEPNESKIERPIEKEMQAYTFTTPDGYKITVEPPENSTLKEIKKPDFASGDTDPEPSGPVDAADIETVPVADNPTVITEKDERLEEIDNDDAIEKFMTLYKNVKNAAEQWIEARKSVRNANAARHAQNHGTVTKPTQRRVTTANIGKSAMAGLPGSGGARKGAGRTAIGGNADVAPELLAHRHDVLKLRRKIAAETQALDQLREKMIRFGFGNILGQPARVRTTAIDQKGQHKPLIPDSNPLAFYDDMNDVRNPITKQREPILDPKYAMIDGIEEKGKNTLPAITPRNDINLLKVIDAVTTGNPENIAYIKKYGGDIEVLSDLGKQYMQLRDQLQKDKAAWHDYHAMWGPSQHDVDRSFPLGGIRDEVIDRGKFSDLIKLKAMAEDESLPEAERRKAKSQFKIRQDAMGDIAFESRYQLRREVQDHNANVDKQAKGGTHIVDESNFLLQDVYPMVYKKPYPNSKTKFPCKSGNDIDAFLKPAYDLLDSIHAQQEGNIPEREFLAKLWSNVNRYQRLRNDPAIAPELKEIYDTGLAQLLERFPQLMELSPELAEFRKGWIKARSEDQYEPMNPIFAKFLEVARLGKQWELEEIRKRRNARHDARNNANK